MHGVPKLFKRKAQLIFVELEFEDVVIPKETEWLLFDGMFLISFGALTLHAA